MLIKYLNKNSILFLFLYSTLIIGFFLNEDLNFGAFNDWRGTNLPVIEYLGNDFKKTILSYDTMGHRHSPIYLIFLSLFYKLGIGPDLIRFINLNFSIVLIYFFYKCLRLRFGELDKNILIIISFALFLSPTFRSLAIWPDSRLVGLIFFTISIYYFLMFQKYYNVKYFWGCLIFLIISSYLSPNFSLFIIFYYFFFLKKISNLYLISSVIFCLISAFPALYYLFVLDINFLVSNIPSGATGVTALSFNLSNKIMIISTIIFFHYIPFFLSKDVMFEIFNFLKRNIIYLLVFFIINLFFFNYSTSLTGGGFFFQISNILFKNNYLFYFIVFFSISIIFYYSKNDNLSLLFFLLLILSNIQSTIYHKYYDPFLLIIYFTILKPEFSQRFMKKKIFRSFYISFLFSIYFFKTCKK